MEFESIKDVFLSQQNHIGIITLARPKALNTLTLPMVLTIQQQLQHWADDPSVHAVIIESDSDKAFCAGGDIRSLYQTRQDKHSTPLPFFFHEYHLNDVIHQYKKPYIALLDGVTMGGGVGVSLHGSHAITSERFLFAMPETSIGFFPDIGASYLLSKCPGAIGTYLALTGNSIHAADAIFSGLIRWFVPSDQFPTLKTALIQEDLSKNAFQRVDECIQRFHQEPAEPSINRLLPLINQAFSADSIEMILSHLKTSSDPSATKIADQLSKKSPLSLKITLHQLRKTQHCSLRECLEIDYCLAQHFMSGVDFYEGVRALLVDKDKAPQWQPSALNEINQSNIEAYFDNHGEKLFLTGSL